MSGDTTTLSLTAELRALIVEMGDARFRVSTVKRRGQWTEDGDLTLRLPAATIRRFWALAKRVKEGEQ